MNQILLVIADILRVKPCMADILRDQDRHDVLQVEPDLSLDDIFQNK